MILLSLAHEAATAATAHAGTLVHAGNGIPNPAPQPPAGVGNQASTIMGIVKWGSLIVIFIGGFVGAGALIVGKIIAHHKSASTGISILVTAVCAVIVWVAIFPFLSSFT